VAPSVFIPLLSLSCAYGIPIRYRIATVSTAPAAENLTVSESTDNRSIYYTYEKNGIRIQVTLFDKTLLPLFTSIRANDAVAVPDALFAFLSVHNYGQDAQRFDLRNLVLHVGGVAHRPLSFREYDRRIYASSLRGYPYYWTFDQKESHRFLHPPPDWYDEIWKSDTSSKIEREAREKALYDLFERNRSSNLILYPGSGIRGIAIFPEPSECECVLRYEGLDEAALNRKFSMPDLPFSLRIDKLANRTAGIEIVPPPGFIEELNGILAEKKELYQMHQQLRIHDALKSRNGLPFPMRFRLMVDKYIKLFQ
jgi:hypothetical protein